MVSNQAHRQNNTKNTMSLNKKLIKIPFIYIRAVLMLSLYDSKSENKCLCTRHMQDNLSLLKTWWWYLQNLTHRSKIKILFHYLNWAAGNISQSMTFSPYYLYNEDTLGSNQFLWTMAMTWSLQYILMGLWSSS